jgi:hypothetical protein
MTIGVRGTIVDISVGNEDSSAMFQEGFGDICGGGSCIQVEHTCQIFFVPRGGTGVSESTGVDRRRRLAVSYPFLTDQVALAPEFRSTANCNVADTRSFNNPPESGSTKGSDGVDRPLVSPTTEDDDEDDEEDDDEGEDDDGGGCDGPCPGDDEA